MAQRTDFWLAGVGDTNPGFGNIALYFPVMPGIDIACLVFGPGIAGYRP